ncbi:MAG: hypothetical protein Kow006_21580 [Gammaproteobacteria bacterium]
MKAINFHHKRSLPAEKDLHRLHGLIALLPGKPGRHHWKALPFGDRLHAQLGKRKAACKPGDLESVTLPGDPPIPVQILFIPEKHDAFQRLTLARKAVSAALSVKPAHLALLCTEDDKKGREFFIALIRAALAANAELPSYKREKPPAPSLERITYAGIGARLPTDRLVAEAEGNELARQLTLEPANKLTPALYLRRIRRLARENGWRTTFFDSAALKRKKAGAFLAVTQASRQQDAGIVHLRYQPGGARGTRVALVGKGICFDTGGINLKTARYMQDMNEDMAGSAAALGVLLALSRMGVDFPVDCWLALAQNHIGPDAYKPSDVVTACNGTTIEVVHSDAEGRMVLADTLALATRRKPSAVIDFATLTGACVYSLSSRYSGVFTNCDALLNPLLEAGRRSGERVWPFPLDDDYDDALESKIADVRQCALEGEADHILAARFLKRFVAEVPWIHIDLAASRHAGGLAHIPTDVTGFGVHYAVELLLGDYLQNL